MKSRMWKRWFRKSIPITLICSLAVTLLPPTAIHANSREAEAMLGEWLKELSPQATITQSVYEGKQSVTGSVYLTAPPPPTLDQLPPAVNGDAVTVSGTAVPGSLVTVRITYQSSPARTESTLADAEGKFSFSIPTVWEQLYKFTATAALNGQVSSESNLVQVRKDSTPPPAPSKVLWTTSGNDQIQLNWESPVNDTDTVKYEIYRDNIRLTETTDRHFTDSNLPSVSLFHYQVRAIDAAGNSSNSETVDAGTPHSTQQFINASAEGVPGNGNAISIALSGDGTKALFLSDADNLVPGTLPTGNPLLYLRDLVQNTIQHIPLPVGAMNPYRPIINGDGSVMAIQADLNDLYQIFIKHPGSDALTPLTLANGEIPNDFSVSPSISDDGNLIAFLSNATNLVENDTPDTLDIFIYDRRTRAVTKVDLSNVLQEAPEWYHIEYVRISGDGKHIVFQHGCGECGGQTYLMELAKPSEAQTFASGYDEVSLSDDGRYVVYNEFGVIYLYDRLASGEEKSRILIENNGDYWYDDPIISGDGKRVTLSAYNFVTNANGLIWLDIATGETKQASNPASYSYASALSNNGSKAAFLAMYTGHRHPMGYFIDGAFTVCPVECSSQPQGEKPIQKVQWNAPMTVRQQLKFGGTVSVTVTGVPGRQAGATVSYKKGNVAESTELILTESTAAPGSYTGSFQLAEGISEVTSLVGRVADSKGIMVPMAAEGLPSSVSAQLQVSIGNLANEDVRAALAGSRMIAWSDAKRTGAQSAVDSEFLYQMALPDAEDYRVSLLAADGELLGELLQVNAAKGVKHHLTLDARMTATLRITITQDPEAPLRTVPLTITRADDPTAVLAVASVKPGAETELRDVVRVSEKIAVTVQLPRPYQPMPPVVVDVNKRNMQITLQPEVRYGTINGTVKKSDGTPVPNVNVTFTQEGIREVSVTDDQGRYSARLPLGVTTVNAVQITGNTTLRAKPDQTVTVTENIPWDIVLLEEKRAEIHVDLYTKRVGEEWRKEDLNYPLVTRFQPALYHPNDSRAYHWSTTNTIVATGYTGQAFKACVIDVLGVMATSCQPLVLDEDYKASVEIRIAEASAFTGTLTAEQPLPSGPITMNLYEADSNGGKGRIVSTGSVAWGKIRGSLPRTGNYIAVFHMYSGAKLFRAEKSFAAIEGSTVDLGTVMLTSGGIFENAAGNSLQALDLPVAEGSRIRLRGTYENGSNQEVVNGTLLLQIPAGASLVAGSIMLNGEPAVSVPVSAHTHEVQLPQTIGPRGKGTIVYQLQLDEAKSDMLNAELGIRFDQAAGSRKVETIGSALIPVTELSLRAPSVVAKKTFTVDGRAVPGSRILVFDGQQQVAETIASAGGYWFSTITLIDSEAQANVHALKAKSITDEKEAYSETAFVKYDPLEPAPLHLVMKNGHNQMTADLSNGVARQPMSIVPSSPISFSVAFNVPERIENVVLKVAGEQVPLARNPLSGRFEGIKSSRQQSLGLISLSYGVKKSAYAASATEEEILKSMPPELRKLDAVVLQDGGSTLRSQLAEVPGRQYVNPVSISSKDYPDEKVDVQFWHSPAEGYTPPQVPPGSPEVYDLKFSYSGSTAQFSAVVPVEKAREIITAFGGDTQALSGPPVVGYVNFGGHFWINIKTPGAGTGLGLAGAVLNGYDFQQKMNDMNAFLDNVTGAECLPPGSGTRFVNKAQELAQELLGILIAKYMMQLAGMALAYSGIGLIGGAAVLATTTGVGYLAMNDWENRYDQLKNHFEEYSSVAADQCDKDEEDPEEPDEPDDPNRPDDPTKPPPDDDPIADPYWIYDPSGFVYEAVESNRLEGVTATAMFREPSDGTWRVWDSNLYGQINPLSTNREGRYAWDVPEGLWKVRFSKDGYEEAFSQELQVLPPHYDVNVGLFSHGAPEVEKVSQGREDSSSFLLLRFSHYMQPATVTTETVSVLQSVYGSDVPPVSIQVEPLQPERNPEGEILSKEFKIKGTFIAGQTYRVVVDPMVLSYAGRPMTEPYEASVMIADRLPAVQEGVSEVSLIGGTNAISLSWKEADDVEFDAVTIRWTAQGASSPAGEQTVKRGSCFASITGLEPGKAYTIRLVSTATGGRESQGITLIGSTLPAPVKPVNTPPQLVTQTAILAVQGGLTVTWTDPEDADLKAIRVSLRKPGESTFGYTQVIPAGKQEARFENTSALGAYEVKLEAVDYLQAASIPVTVTYNVTDVTPPVTSFDIAPVFSPDGSYVEGIIITLTAADADSGISRIETRANGGPWVEYKEPIQLKANEMVWTFEFRSYDRAGNREWIHVIDFANGTISQIEE
ncbi:fibronectin type III domain-containing protein [Paenibacillus sp. GD4]|uniref:OmpL47-type beta-barrel domain-containing protein n=1 Tax=Paenibacillus sp. GD4 TaxID=3068890 RepID=UPI0027964512|nr:fibronectin type III domain-containing protein [Paenibacillus sp. GD4]MDQ1913859.1 fibronectin type III domain-containing protein [Paenibacillus sp. GD4]